MRENLLIFAYFNLFLIKVFCAQLNFQGPVFTDEPPRKVEFSNIYGGKVDCRARGIPIPEVEWIHPDGTSVAQIPDVRLVHRNGSLIFPSFPAEKFRVDVHAVAYRCIAKNQVGTILSKETIVKAVVNQKYDIQVYDAYVIAGNTAVLKCQVPSHLSDYVLVTSWTQDDVVHIYSTTETGGKYATSKTGELFVFNIGPNDVYKSYFCRTVNKLTGESKSNTSPARIILSEVKGKVQPKLGVDRHSTIYAKLEEDVILKCLAQGYPIPTFQWFKEENEKSFLVEFNERITKIGNGLLVHIDKVKLKDGGKYICLINNSAGQDTIYINLHVTAALSVNVQPQNQIIDVNKEASFLCVVNGSPISSVSWFHNGRLLTEDERHKFIIDTHNLLIKPVQKNDFGMYQCFVSNDWDMVQSSAELRLGDASPEFLTTFEEQTLQPGPSLSLKCIASGNPPPHFFWSLDGFPVPDNERFMMGQYITVADDVITHLNITSTQEEDGGEYTCTAKNSISQVSHSARINIYGRPRIRQVPKINAVAGQNLILKCPVAGYPIKSIFWEQGGVSLPVNRKQKLFSNGTLVIEGIQKRNDEGIYTCRAENDQKLSDRGDVEVYVMIPPKILPIQEIVLQEGMRAAITCQITEGDLPFKFYWEKNGRAVTGPKPSVRRIDEYASLLVIDNISMSHAGNYTCFAENVAGIEFFTVPLTVNVPPKWQIEPTDANAIAGFDVMINCQATGHPKPFVVWKKSSGSLFGEYKEFIYEQNILFHPNGSIQITKVSKENEGHYLCEAKNEIGSGVSKLIYLKVNVRAHFPEKFKRVQVVKGGEARLQCSVVGDVPVEIQWKFDGKQIQENENRYTIREQSLDGGLVSELNIAQTFRQDTGVFTCYGSNFFGRDEMQIHLIVQEVPEPPTNIKINHEKSRSIEVTWSQPYAGNSPITNYIVQIKMAANKWENDANEVIIPGTKSFTTILGLKPAQSYVLRIFAENVLGKSEPSESVQTTTQEEAPSGAPLNVKAKPETSTQINVVWDPPLKDHLNGKLLGYYVGYQEHASVNASDNASYTFNGYTFETVKAETEMQSSKVTLKNLNKFTTYSVIVQAFNNKGAGPFTTPVFVSTKEDVPSLPPKNIYCHSTSSQSIEIGWESPDVEGLHGILLGYKLSYGPTEEFAFGEKTETKVTTLTKTIISGLLKFTNYSVSLLSFTSAGDGVKSDPIWCGTDEDVPSAPEDVKAAFSSISKIKIAWLPPKYKNGELICYTVYTSLIENKKEKSIQKRILSPDTEFYETVRHQSKEVTYKFWVTASTKIGEGESSKIVTILPSNNVPARIMSFGQNIVTPWKITLNLTCLRVGVPFPQPVWRFNHNILEKPKERIQIYKDGSLIIKNVQKSDEGNYTCSVENLYGKDKMIYNLVVKVPPDRPRVSVISTTNDSLHLQWFLETNNDNEILGYIINYKRDQGDWEELQLEPEFNYYSLKNLQCATRYQLYVTAFNKVGMGLPCDILNTFTLGGVPVKPKEKNVVKVNSTTALVLLNSWNDGGCPIVRFVVEYQIMNFPLVWYLASNGVKPSDQTFVLSNLKPGTRYTVKITAHNNAGSSSASYNFTTLANIGVLPKEKNNISIPEKVPFYYSQGNIILIIFLVGFALSIVGIGFMAFIKRKNRMEGTLTDLTEPKYNVQIKNEQNEGEHYYHSIKEAPRKFSFPAKKDDYSNETYPYTAFKIFKPPYSENSYSGNVYSGTYNFVKSSFPFSDVKSELYKTKMNEDFRLKKFCEKSDYLGDLQTESKGYSNLLVKKFIFHSESENFGSTTDSEVKKIMSVHLHHMSECETLDSDSEEELNSARGTKSHPQNEIVSFRKTQKSGKYWQGKHKNNGEESSSSSERSRKTLKFSQKKTKFQGRSGRTGRRSKSADESSMTFGSHPTLKGSNTKDRSKAGLKYFKDKSDEKQNLGIQENILSKFHGDEPSFQINV